MKGDINIDKHFTLDAMTDFSNQYGNEALKEIMLEWLKEKMGGGWELKHTFIKNLKEDNE